ncbi:MAG: cobyrinate a,c-diamide synthase [Deltaproteobacteria bacterium]|nr:cobyrinate a,c-diamide synthase [Deltaproteobacteria bacterium]
MLNNILSGKAFSGFCLAAIQSGSGKTTITLALLRALKERGYKIMAGKCGPDYIDPMFHEQAAGCKSINLDTWMMGSKGVQKTFASACAKVDIAVVEGVMGLFDGALPTSIEGSSAACAKLLGLPVILVVDVKGMAGSIAPLVKGFAEFHKQVVIVGVIANNVGSSGHADLLQKALASAGLPPLVGALPKNPSWKLDERYLGLIPFDENHKSEKWFSLLAEGAEKHINIEQLLQLTQIRRPQYEEKSLPANINTPAKKRLAIARDAAFNFYYHDNLKLLEDAGFELVDFSPLEDLRLPRNIAGLYVGGGFPEVFAQKLAGNERMRESIRSFAEEGGHIYAECGGFMYLGQNITDNKGLCFPMCGIFAANSKMSGALRSLGYREVTTLAETVFGPTGTILRGHEFHWSEMTFKDDAHTKLFIQSNSLGEKNKSGIIGKNTLASYVHLHFLSNPEVVCNWHKRL